MPVQTRSMTKAAAQKAAAGNDVDSRIKQEFFQLLRRQGQATTYSKSVKRFGDILQYIMKDDITEFVLKHPVLKKAIGKKLEEISSTKNDIPIYIIRCMFHVSKIVFN